jgi:hypothetical protein
VDQQQGVTEGKSGPETGAARGEKFGIHGGAPKLETSMAPASAACGGKHSCAVPDAALV